MSTGKAIVMLSTFGSAGTHAFHGTLTDDLGFCARFQIC